MSDLARQYNIIGETLRTGIGDLLQGQAAGKALDIQAMKMGIAGEQQKFEHLQRKKEFGLKQESYDLNRRIAEDALNNPIKKRDEAIAEAQMERHNKPATEYSIGIDEAWEKEWFEDVIAPLMEDDLGISRNTKGEFVDRDNVVIKDGEIKQNTDIAGLMIANLDPSHMVRKKHQLEVDRLGAMSETGYFDSRVGDNEMKQREIAAQQKLVGQLDAQLVDIKDSPIKYLNAQIDTLGNFMAGFINPSVHMIKFKELSARRDGMIELMKSQNKAASANMYEQEIFDEKGVVIFKKHLHQSVRPDEDRDIMNFMNARHKMGLQSHLSKPSDPTNKIVAAITGSMGGSIALTQAYQEGGVMGAAKWLRDAHNAAAWATKGKTMKLDPIADGLNELRTIGIDPFAPDFNVADAVNELLKDVPDDATDEETRKLLGDKGMVIKLFLEHQGS